jgi:hypothetical protein
MIEQIDPPATRKSPLAEWLFVMLQNTRHIHERWMARFLERRGWVVFYLEEYARNCPSQGACWLELYQSGRKSGSVKQNPLD